ncbi:hypothetical protein TSMEX_011117, partial [Taenia solium]
NEKGEAFDAQSADEESRLAEGNLWDAIPDTTSATRIDTQSDEPQDGTQRASAVDDPTATQKEGDDDDNDDNTERFSAKMLPDPIRRLPLRTEQYEEALEEGQDEPQPESELRRTMEGAGEGTAMEPEVEAIPDADGKPSYFIA